MSDGYGTHVDFVRWLMDQAKRPDAVGLYAHQVARAAALGVAGLNVDDPLLLTKFAAAVDEYQRLSHEPEARG